MSHHHIIVIITIIIAFTTFILAHDLGKILLCSASLRCLAKYPKVLFAVRIR